MEQPQANFFLDGRLHLNHGPIDLIIEAWGPDKTQAYQQAEHRFATVLDELVVELEILRQPLDVWPLGDIARQMAAVVALHPDQFVTPMAAVAGAVADTVCAAMVEGLLLDKAYVNNGGDIAFYLAEGQSLSAAIIEGSDKGRAYFTAEQSARGLATSGWRGRSFSMGIADAVTVVASTAAHADVAATLIANAVDIGDHLAIKRQAANQLAPDSDLGERLVTTDVGLLSDAEVWQALQAGKRLAGAMCAKGLIDGAMLFLVGQQMGVGQDSRGCRPS